MVKTPTTYQRPEQQEHVPPPEVKTPFNKIKTIVQKGERLHITRRVMMFNPAHWSTYDIEGIVIELAPNALILDDHTIIPYYVITDWKVVD